MAIRNVDADELQRPVAAGEPLFVDLVKDNCPWSDRQEPALARVAEKPLLQRNINSGHTAIKTEQMGVIVDDAIFCSAKYLRPLTRAYWRQS